MINERKYKECLFEKISDIIENIGQEDSNYDNYQKARDILEVLEGLLAYAIYNTCVSPETIRDSAEESYVNIKKKALEMYKKYGVENNA